AIAPDATTPSPTMSAGAFASTRSRTASSMALGSGRTAVGTRLGGSAGAAHGAVLRSNGSERTTGPRGGVSATFSARRTTCGISSALRISYAHFTHGEAYAVKSPESVG